EEPIEERDSNADETGMEREEPIEERESNADETGMEREEIQETQEPEEPIEEREEAEQPTAPQKNKHGVELMTEEEIRNLLGDDEYLKTRVDKK
ncbi:MAG: hypothetical protein WC337_11730, partial [Candidatus Muiribacteriota bacterium]